MRHYLSDISKNVSLKLCNHVTYFIEFEQDSEEEVSLEQIPEATNAPQSKGYGKTKRSPTEVSIFSVDFLSMNNQ